MSHTKNHIKKIKIDFTGLNKVFNIKGPEYDYMYLSGDELLDKVIPWNKDKTGLQQSTRKGGNREDLSPEARKRIADKVRAYNLGRTHTKETKEKIRQLKLGKKRPDLIGNSFASNRDNSKYRTEAFRQKMREIAKKRWANA